MIIIFILNPLPGGDHLAPEAGVSAVVVSYGAPIRVRAADTVRDPRGAVAVGAVPAVSGGGHPPGSPHLPRSLPRHRVPCGHGGTVAGLGGAVDVVRAAHDVTRLASG